MQTKSPTFSFFCLCCLAFGFNTTIEMEAAAIDEKAVPVLPAVSELEKRAGLKFGPKTEIIFHHIDTQRLPGRTEWIVVVPGFMITPKTFPAPPIKMFDNLSLQKSLIARIASIKINNPQDSYRASWKTSSNESFVCDVLFSDGPPILLLVKE